MHLDGGGRCAVDDVGPQALDGPVLLVGLVQAPDAVQGGQPAAVQLDPLVGVLDVDQPERALQQGVHLRVVGDRLRLLGGAAQQRDRLPAFPRVEDLRRPGQGQELPGRRREEIGRRRQPPRRRQPQVAQWPGADPGEHRVPDPVVPEPDGRRSSGLRDQDAVGNGRRERRL